MYVLANMWFQKLMRQFFFNIDNIVFNFISSIYDLLITIARTSILSQGDIIDMADRIYKLLAIFMIFKVTFSLIMYVVNPDDFSDKSKGISKLGTNIVIALALLILTPYVFNMGYSLQKIILEDNSIASLIFGDDKEKNEYLNTAGQSMAFTTIQPFFSPNVSIDEMANCTTIDKDCFTDMGNMISGENDKGDFTNTMLKNYEAGIGNSNLGLTFRQDLAAATDQDNENFIMDYKYIFSTITGVIIILLLITYCMDVAVRSIKLAFLQLVAPIPIISYVDPKSGKDGLFKKWYQMCFKTYLSLFIRILALYFAIFIIGKVADMRMVDIVDGSTQSSKLVAVFIIIGALMFAKQLPKILEGLGIKLDGGFTLNPLKKIENEALGGKRIASFTKAAPAAALAGAAALGANGLGAIQNFQNSKGTGFKNRAKTALRGVGSTLAGGLSGTTRGLKGAVKGEKFGKNFTSSYSGAMQAKQSRADRLDDDVGFLEMMQAKFTQNIGGHTKGEIVKSAADTSKKIQSVYDSMMNSAVGNDKATFTANVNGVNRSFDGIKGLTQFMDEVKKTSIKRENYATEQQYLDALEEQDKLVNRLDDIKKERLNDIASGAASTQDAATTNAIREGYKQMQSLVGDLNKSTRAIDPNIAEITASFDAKTINGMAKGISNQITASTSASHATTVDQYAAKKKQS